MRALSKVPGSSSARERARRTRRQIILEAAEDVFADRGFRGATMTEIARRSGYSAGNLYNVFENKEALFVEVLASRATRLLGLVREALASSDELAVVIDRFVDVLIEFVGEHRGFFMIVTQTHLDFDWHEPGTGGSDLRDEFDRELETIFAQAIERRQLAPASPRSYVSLVQGTLNSHIARWARVSGDTHSLRAPVQELKQLLKRGLGLPTDEG